MKCSKCEGEWTPPPGRSVTVCPFCGENLKSSLRNESSNNVVETIIHQYGEEILFDPRRFLALIDDFIPKEEQLRSRLRLAINEKVPQKLAELKSVTEQDREYRMKFMAKQFIDTYDMAMETACKIVNYFADALGYNLIEMPNQSNNNKLKINNIVSYNKPKSVDIYGECLYYTEEQRNIYKISADGKKQKICDDLCSEFIILDEWIYYCDRRDDNRFYKININGSSRQKLSEDSFAEYMGDDEYYYTYIIINEWVYYNGCEDNYILLYDNEYDIYRMRLDGSVKQKLIDKCNNMHIIDEWIYFSDIKNGRKLCKMRLDGSDKKVITDDRVGYLSLLGEWIYYNNIVDRNIIDIYKMRLDGNEKQKLINNSCGSFNIVGEWIYYHINNDRYSLYKVRLDGAGKQKLIDNQCSYIKIVGEWIYYANSDDGYSLYRISINGTDKQKLNNDRVGIIDVIGDWVFYYFHKILCKIRIDGTERQLIDIEQNKSCYVQNNDGSYTITNFIVDNCENMIIPNHYQNKPVTEYRAHSFHCTDVQNLIIEHGIKVIGKGAFDKCYKLAKIDLPDTLIEISDYAFSECNLIDVIFPQNLEKIGNYAFKKNGIISLLLPKSLIYLGWYAFANCFNLTEVTIFENIVALRDGTFQNCSSLKKINLHNKLNVICSRAFENCSELTELFIPNSVNKIGKDAFIGTAKNFNIFCNRNSYAEQYAIDNKIMYQLLDGDI